MNDYLGAAYLISAPAIIVICLISRISIARLFQPETWLEWLSLIASLAATTLSAFASQFRLPLPHGDIVMQTGSGLLLAYVWLRAVRLVLIRPRPGLSPLDSDETDSDRDKVAGSN